MFMITWTSYYTTQRTIVYVCVWILQDSAQLMELLAKSDDLMMLTLAHLVSPAFLRLLQAR